MVCGVARVRRRQRETAVPPHASIPFLREVVIFLVASGVVVPVFHRLRLSPVLGYLVVGTLIGPYGLGVLAPDLGWLSHVVITDVEGVRPLAELGVIFLLFVIGLELSFERLWALRHLVFGLGSLQVAASALLIGAVAWGWGHPPQVSVLLGMCLALSSTAIVMQLLMEWRRLGTPLGRTSFSILLFQDLAVVPILFVLGVFGAGQAAADVWVDLFVAVVEAAAVIGAIYVTGMVAVRPLLRFVSRTGSPEMFIAAILLVVIGASAITGRVGLSMELGAFLAGLLLAGTEFRHEIFADIEPFKGLLLGLFFMTVGMGIDTAVIVDHAFWLGLSVVGLFLVKAAVIGGLGLAFGLPRHVALEAGLLLGQGGELAFVVIGLALSLDLMPRDTAQFMLLVTGLGIMVTPVVAALGQRLGATLERRHETRWHIDGLDAAAEAEAHVIIAGFGRVGQMLGRILGREGVPFLALDLDAPAIARHRTDGLPVAYGDASRIEMLKRTRAETAAAVVITLDDPEAAERVVRSVRSRWVDLPIFARARDERHARQLLDLGASEVVPETVEASLQLSLRVLRGVGIPEEVSLRHIDSERQAAMDDFPR
jgi:CPA2 family monovalent cation:H+ antiporter-2